MPRPLPPDSSISKTLRFLCTTSRMFTKKKVTEWGGSSSETNYTTDQSAWASPLLGWCRHKNKPKRHCVSTCLPLSNKSPSVKTPPFLVSCRGVTSSLRISSAAASQSCRSACSVRTGRLCCRYPKAGPSRRALPACAAESLYSGVWCHCGGKKWLFDC